MSSPTPAKNWCFTLHNETKLWMQGDECVPPMDVGFVVYGREACPTSGRIHLQGYLQLKTKKRFAQVQHMLNTGSDTACHVEKAKGNYTQNYKYCTKEGDFTEWGEPNKGFGEKGNGSTREDLNRIRDRIFEGADYAELIQDDDLNGSVARYLPYVRATIAEYERGAGKDKLIKKMSEAVLKPWQRKLDIITDQEPDDRKVHWYWEKEGNSGKSFMVSYLCAMKDAVVFTHGKVGDIAHAYRGERIVCIDLARTQAENLQAIYMVIENFKNGRIFSGKYESTTKVFDTPHVVVFANFEPDKKMLSEDRWDIHPIKKM